MDEKKKKDTLVRQALVMVTQVGISMMTPILLCGVLGFYLDRWLATGYWFVILIILGILAAFRNVYLLMRKFYAKDLEKEKQQLQYEKELKEYSKEHGAENIDDLKVRRVRKRDGGGYEK